MRITNPDAPYVNASLYEQERAAERALAAYKRAPSELNARNLADIFTNLAARWSAVGTDLSGGDPRLFATGAVRPEYSGTFTINPKGK